ncbi:MAG: glycosyltransferase family 39 protein [Anaerolineales bacterium]|nr:glycosyltransferase family 39 protein [Anaerolineales bacterium]
MNKKLFYIFIGIYVLFGATYHQPYVPATWLDEGFVLQGATNLVDYGEYAMMSSEGFRILDQPLIANGPGVVLPITLIFKLFGVGLLQARLVVVAFLLVFVMLYYLSVRKLFGETAAVLALLLLLAVPREGIFYYGRLALGNVPALAYFLAGFLLLLHSYDDNGFRSAIGAGLFFGLAMVTKGQFGLILPALMALIVFDWVFFKRLNLKKSALTFGVAVAMMGLWFLIQFYMVGFENIDQHLASIRSSSEVTVSAFRIERIPTNLWYLVRSGYVLFVLPGLVYATVQLFKRRDRRQLFLVIFILGWTAWNVIATVGWPRYLFTPYVLGLVLTGKFLADLVASIQSEGIGKGSALAWGRNLLVAGIAIGAVYAFGVQVVELFSTPDDSAQVFSSYLEEHIEEGALVESWEWQLDILADVNYHHPPNDLVDKQTAYIHYGDEFVTNYNPFYYQPEYLIIGPFSKGMTLYSQYIEAGCCQLVFQSGDYDLYKVNNDFIRSDAWQIKNP